MYLAGRGARLGTRSLQLCFAAVGRVAREGMRESREPELVPVLVLVLVGARASAPPCPPVRSQMDSAAWVAVAAEESVDSEPRPAERQQSGGSPPSKAPRLAGSLACETSSKRSSFPLCAHFSEATASFRKQRLR